MKKAIIASLFLALAFTSCKNEDNTSPVPEEELPTEIKKEDMNSFISLFEIPASDISRAIQFYESILDISIEKMEMPGMEMGIFPYEGQMVTGIIMKGEDYKPSADGVTIYLNGGKDLQVILDRIEGNGGTILVPKTAHADESGYFALFLDSEGNKLGLNSPN